LFKILEQFKSNSNFGRRTKF